MSPTAVALDLIESLRRLGAQWVLHLSLVYTGVNDQIAGQLLLR